MRGITDPPHANYTYSVQDGILVGIDMVMVPESFTEYLDALISLVKNNVIPMSMIDDVVKRILRVKFRMGLFENPMGDLSLANQLGSKEHRELAREAVRKSLVLLKNGKGKGKKFIPLPKKASKILVAGRQYSPPSIIYFLVLPPPPSLKTSGHNFEKLIQLKSLLDNICLKYNCHQFSFDSGSKTSNIKP